MVENLPTTVIQLSSREEAEEVVECLISAGGSVKVVETT